MALVTLNKKEIKKIIGNLTDEKIDETLSMFGTAVEKIDDEKIEVEIAPNRPDLLSQQGIERALGAFVGKSPGLKKYAIKKPQKNYRVKIEPSVKNVRPFTACAIVKNLSFNDDKIKEIIELQEKLHSTLGRNRKKIAIGIYPLEKIKLPITYEARKPEEIKFIPLEAEKEMSAMQILQRHPTGRAYAELLENCEKFPVFIDADKKILSMPPVINSHETGKITERTKDVFIECSGFNLELLQKTLNIIATTLAEMGGEIYQMNLEYISKKTITPNLTPEKKNISIEKTNKLLGLNLKESDLSKLLPKMGYNYKSGKVEIPAWRTDILHEVDLIEDIAIAYGYDKFTPRIPSIANVGELSFSEKAKEKIAEILCGLGMIEISTYHLIKQKEAETSSLNESKILQVENSKTEYKILRPNLLIPSLRVLSENKNNEYPQKIFELGTVFSRNKEISEETGIKESQNLCVVSTPANFTEIKQILNYLAQMLGVQCELEESVHQDLISGRTASVSINKKPVGYIGEIHPATLKAWNLKMPAAVFEISLEEIFDFLKE